MSNGNIFQRLNYGNTTWHNPIVQEEEERKKTSINAITHRKDIRMSTYQVRFKYRSEASVKKKNEEKEKSLHSLC